MIFVIIVLGILLITKIGFRQAEVVSTPEVTKPILISQLTMSTLDHFDLTGIENMWDINPFERLDGNTNKAENSTSNKVINLILQNDNELKGKKGITSDAIELLWVSPDLNDVLYKMSPSGVCNSNWHGSCDNGKLKVINLKTNTFYIATDNSSFISINSDGDGLYLNNDHTIHLVDGYEQYIVYDLSRHSVVIDTAKPENQLSNEFSHWPVYEFQGDYLLSFNFTSQVFGISNLSNHKQVQHIECYLNPNGASQTTELQKFGYISDYVLISPNGNKLVFDLGNSNYAWVDLSDAWNTGQIRNGDCFKDVYEFQIITSGPLKNFLFNYKWFFDSRIFANNGYGAEPGISLKGFTENGGFAYDFVRSEQIDKEISYKNYYNDLFNNSKYQTTTGIVGKVVVGTNQSFSLKPSDDLLFPTNSVTAYFECGQIVPVFILETGDKIKMSHYFHGEKAVVSIDRQTKCSQ